MTDETRRRADKRKPGPLQVLARRERWVVASAEMRAAGLSRDIVARHREAGTLVDLAMLVDEAVLDTAVHEADNLKRLYLRKVDEAIARAGATRQGVPALRRSLRRYRPANGRLDTDTEK